MQIHHVLTASFKSDDILCYVKRSHNQSSLIALFLIRNAMGFLLHDQTICHHSLPLSYSSAGNKMVTRLACATKCLSLGGQWLLRYSHGYMLCCLAANEYQFNGP